jgi:hypothetical protein
MGAVFAKAIARERKGRLNINFQCVSASLDGTQNCGMRSA